MNKVINETNIPNIPHECEIKKYTAKVYGSNPQNIYHGLGNNDVTVSVYGDTGDAVPCLITRGYGYITLTSTQTINNVVIIG